MMKDFLFKGCPLQGKGNDFFLFLFRVFIGAMMLVHGFSKLGAFHLLSVNFPDPLGVTPVVSLLLSILAEVGCSFLLIFGILTRLATLPLLFNMIVAVWVVYGNDSFQVKELGLLYFGAYLLFFFTGGGRYSLDGLFFRQRRGRGI